VISTAGYLTFRNRKIVGKEIKNLNKSRIVKILLFSVFLTMFVTSVFSLETMAAACMHRSGMDE